MKEKKTKGRPLLPQVLCGLALCFTMLIFAPVEMVTLNNINFWFSAADFLPMFIGLFAAAFLAFEAACLLMRKLPYALWLLAQAVAFGLLVCVYVQGTYLCMGSEALISDEPVWREMRREMLVNAGIWAAILLGSIALSMAKPKWFLRVVPAVSALILVMEGAALAVLMTGSSYNSDINYVYCSDDEQFTFSDNGDVIMIMLDTFDTRLMDQALAEDPDYADVFEDFTYYRNNSASMTRTESSFVSFMTGQVCYNEEPFLMYCRRAFRESRFFPIMKDAGMTVNVYGAPPSLFSVEQLSQVDNLRTRDAHISDPVQFINEMCFMISYRYLPTMMQPFMLESYIERFAVLQEMEEENLRESTDDPLTFVRAFRENGVTIDSERRFYKLFALRGAHYFYEMNRYMERAESDGYEQLLGCFALLKQLFAQLEEEGAWDKATVIVFGDHGFNPDAQLPCCNSALLVKYPGEKGPMRISNAPVELLDMRATALYGAGLDYAQVGTPVHEWEGVQNRDRRSLSYYYSVPSSYDHYLNRLLEYIVPQDATDLSAYERSGRVFSRPQ